MFDLNINLLLILALIFVFLITISFLSKYNICDNGLCNIYDNYQTHTINYLIYFLILIFILIIIWYLFFGISIT